MNALTHLNLVKRMGFVGVLAAGLAAAGPAIAELKPQSETLPANPVSPAPVNATEIAPTAREITGETTSETTSETGQTTLSDSVNSTQTPASQATPSQVAPAPTTPSQITPGAGADQIAPGMSAPTLTPSSQVPPSQTSPSQTSPSQISPSQTAPAETAPDAGTGAGTGAAASNGTIVDIATASDSFTTLVAALTEAELTEVLSGEGPFTVFTPTNEAFAALPDGTVEELLKPENRDRLVEILTYHVVPGSYPSSSLAAGQVQTAEGESVTITTDAGKVMVNDANVIQPDIAASNGVIHVIDRVMLPPSR